MTITCPPGQHIETVEMCVDDPLLPTWTDLGPCPSAASMPTPTGKVIRGLTPFNGRIFAAYGDWTATNHAPCDLTGYEPTGGTWDILLGDVAADAVWTIRALGNGELWALVTDPSAGADPDAIVYDGTAIQLLRGGWSPYPWHLFDVVAWQGAYYLAGAERVGAASYATVWRGESLTGKWTKPLSLPFKQRCYALFVLNDALFAITERGQGYVSRDGVRFDPTGTALWPGAETTKVVVIGDRAIALSGWANGGAHGLTVFDGKTLSATGFSVRDVCLDGDRVVGVTDDLRVVASEDGLTWTDVASDAPSDASSVGVLDGTVYVGTTTGHLWRWG